MIGDLLTGLDFVLKADGSIETDNQGNPVTIEKSQVYPIHKDDELILFQTPYEGDLGNNANQIYNNGQNGCKCCYGYSRIALQRSRTIRQKYKYTGCSWVWYPPKYLFNYDQNIPQCGIAYEKIGGSTPDFNVNCFEFASGFNAGNAEPEEGPDVCTVCTQINPMLTNSNLNDAFGNKIFDIYGNFTGADASVSPMFDVRPLASGWHLQFTSTLYPGQFASDGECCSCVWADPTIPQIVPDYSTSCWGRTGLRYVPGKCNAISSVRSGQNILSKNGGYFYSTFEGRIRGREGSKALKESEVFVMGEGTEPAYFYKAPESVYKPSSGGYLQNSCTFCSLSPYLRDMAYNDYPWAYNLFCAGGSRSASAKTYNFPISFIKTGFWTLPPEVGLYSETIVGGSTNIDIPMEQWIEVLGEHTFYSQLVGMVQLEHYWEYTGVNKSDLDAAVKTIPYGLEEGADVQDRWNYWKQRTTPRMFVLKSSATPLFTFDLVYADRIGIFQKFADPDQSATQPDGSTNIDGRMTIGKFLSYFSTFSNGYFNKAPIPIDDRGRAAYPPGCDEPGYKYVRIVKEIIDAMCEAGIIGTRDHRQNIYNEIKQIIETGLENGSNGAYYKPLENGNPIFVTPDDFNKLKEKYYTPYERMCTPAEMFPGIDSPIEETRLNAFGKFGPIRKIIPPSYIFLPDVSWDVQDWRNNNDGENPPEMPAFIYKSNGVNPDDIFTDGPKQVRSCVDGTILQTTSRKKIQDLQYSKYYSGGVYSAGAPDYVNSQLFFRAIPGRWSFVKWAPMTSQCEWCNRQSSPCSAYEIYGEGPPSTGEPGYLWHSEGIRTTLYKGNSKFSNTNLYAGGYSGMCNGINATDSRPLPVDSAPDGTDCTSAPGDIVANRTLGALCGFQSIAWDASGSPSTVKCVPSCSKPNDYCCDNTIFPCGCECTGIKDCAQTNIEVNGNSNWTPELTCKQLFGENCCECIGKDPNQNLTMEEYADLMIDQRKCETCGEDCNFGCPEETTPLFTAEDANTTFKNSYGTTNTTPVTTGDARDDLFGTRTNYASGINTGGPGGGVSTGGGQTDGQGNVCDNTDCDNEFCGPQPAIGPCDTQCGYNGLSYDNLAFVLQQNNYNYGRTYTVSADDETQQVRCTVCKCSGYNTCYVRFAGKVQKYGPNSQTGFYEPQEDQNGNLFNTGYINMDTPYHYLSPSSKAGRDAISLVQDCNNSCRDSTTNPDIYCRCENINTIGTIMCPGGIVKAYKQNPSDCQLNSKLWCGYFRSGRVILKPITMSDVDDTNYAYV
jgi:hypothetical protein